MILAEYLRFLQTLNIDEVAADVRKIANLVLQHLDTLIPLSTAQGQRIKKIAELAQTNWSSVSSDIQPPSKQVAEQTCPITPSNNPPAQPGAFECEPLKAAKWGR